MSGDAAQRLLDRAEVTEAVYRYASTIDAGDWDGLRDALTDDVRVKYGNGPWIEGADVLVPGLRTAMSETVARHHLFSVYRVEVSGDEATALCYATSHTVFPEEREVARVTVGRYHERLRRTPSGWRIARMVMEVLWAEERHDIHGRLAAMGGRGPAQLEV